MQELELALKKNEGGRSFSFPSVCFPSVLPPRVCRVGDCAVIEKV